MITLDSKLLEIAKVEDIILVFREDLKNKAYSANREIILGDFNNEDCKIAAFFHELAHIKRNKLIIKSDFGKIIDNRFYYFSTLSNEALCWELGFRLAFNYGYKWSDEHEVYKYAYKNLLSYLGTEADLDLLPSPLFITDINQLRRKLLNE